MIRPKDKPLCRQPFESKGDVATSESRTISSDDDDFFETKRRQALDRVLEFFAEAAPGLKVRSVAIAAGKGRGGENVHLRLTAQPLSARPGK